MENLLLLFLVVLTPSCNTADGQNAAALDQQESHSDGESANRRSSDPNTLILLEMFKLSRDMNSLKEQVEKQGEELEFLKVDYRKLEDKQGSDIESLKIDTQKQGSNLETLKVDTKNLQESIARRDTYIQSQICKARSVKLPSSCTSGECCMKHMIESMYTCLPNCEKSPCPQDYDVYKSGGFCYKIHSECSNWEDARKVCMEEGGDLIVLSDENAFGYFQTLVKTAVESKCAYTGYWLGLTDKDKESEWKWVDGSVAGKNTPWGPGEPSGSGIGGGGKLCAHVESSQL